MSVPLLNKTRHLCSSACFHIEKSAPAVFGRAVWISLPTAFPSHPCGHISLPLSLSPPARLWSCSSCQLLFFRNGCGSSWACKKDSYCCGFFFCLPGSQWAAQRRASIEGLSPCRTCGWLPCPPWTSASVVSVALKKKIRLSQILVVARDVLDLRCGLQTLSWDMWDLVPWPRVEPGPPALGVQSLSHWTTGEIPWWHLMSRMLPWALCGGGLGLIDGYLRTWLFRESPPACWPLFLIISFLPVYGELPWRNWCGTDHKALESSGHGRGNHGFGGKLRG